MAVICYHHTDLHTYPPNPVADMESIAPKCGIFSTKYEYQVSQKCVV